jgi:peroxiredoxin-like protein
MQALPHYYDVQVNCTPESNILATSQGVPNLVVAGPAAFDGPGDQWSPETLLLSAVANCFVLTFKAIANASNFPWKAIECESKGKLDKVDRTMKFTEITSRVKLTIKDPAAEDKALKLLNKVEPNCLVSNSLNVAVKLQYEVIIEQ